MNTLQICERWEIEIQSTKNVSNKYLVYGKKKLATTDKLIFITPPSDQECHISFTPCPHHQRVPDFFQPPPHPINLCPLSENNDGLLWTIQKALLGEGGGEWRLGEAPRFRYSIKLNVVVHDELPRLWQSLVGAPRFWQSSERGGRGNWKASTLSKKIWTVTNNSIFHFGHYDVNW